MKVLYKGGPPELAIAGTDIHVERGVAVEVPDDIAEKLLDQGWEAEHTHSHKEKTKSPVEATEATKEVS